MREEFSYHVKHVSDKGHKELQPQEVMEIFNKDYINREDVIAVRDVHFDSLKPGFKATATVTYHGETTVVEGIGNGRLDATGNAIKKVIGEVYTFDSYTEHALDVDSHASAASYVSIFDQNGKMIWGVGVDDDIILSSIKALVSALNRKFDQKV